MDLSDLSRKLEKWVDFPALPGIAAQVINEIDSKNVSMEALGKLILKDVCFSAHLVRHANSPAHASAGKVSSVPQAIRVMGLQEVKGLCMSVPIFTRFHEVLGIPDLWYHCRISSLCCRIFAENTNLADPDVAETAGLLHDLGKVFITIELPQLMELQLQTADTLPWRPVCLREMEILGTTHCLIGARYARMFNFPRDLLESILWHHQPDKADYSKSLTHLCCLGDQIASIIGAPDPDSIFVDPVILRSLDHLGIRLSRFRLILEECLRQGATISSLDFVLP